MDRSSIGDVVRFRASMLKEILEGELGVELKRLLVNVVETYFKLDPGQKEELRRLLATEEYRDMRDTEMTYFEELEERARKEGREEGSAEGREAGKRETLLRLLTSKFGPLSEAVVLRVNAIVGSGSFERKVGLDGEGGGPHGPPPPDGLSDLPPDLASTMERGVDVGVGDAAPNLADRFLHLSHADPFVRGPDDVRGFESPGHQSRSAARGRFRRSISQVGAEKEHDAPVHRRLTQVDVGLAHASLESPVDERVLDGVGVGIDDAEEQAGASG
jgi:hypothetical protein